MSEAGKIEQALSDVIADHPMWIGADGKPLDYSSEREALIARFVFEAAAKVREAIGEEEPEPGGRPEWLSRTEVTVQQRGPLHWIGEVMYDGFDYPSVFAFTERGAERRARAKLAWLRRRDERRRRTHRTLDV